MTEKAVILLEFNELTPSLMHRFMSAGDLPNFSKLHRESQVHVTDAEEAPGTGRLNPWVQWVSIHSGLSTDEHGIFKLSDGHKLTKDRIWDTLSAADRKVWVCGSMNAFFKGSPKGFVLPDPWSDKVKPFPENTFEAYYHFVRTQVQEHTNKKVPLSASDYRRFMTFMMTHGLSLNTIIAVLKQLASERLQKGVGWRRATLMDRFQFDVFRHYWRKHRPHFATFFLNSTAHFQHKFWRDMEPEKFLNPSAAEEGSAQRDAIRFGYQQMDQLVGRFLKLAGKEATILFATGLSQQPCLKFEESGGKRFYRPLDFKKLFNTLNLPGPYQVVPVMSEEFHLYFEDETCAETARGILASQHVAEEAVFTMKRQGNELFGGCRIHHDLPKTSRLQKQGENQDLPFYEFFYQAEAVKSGMHHPDGMLWIRQPQGKHRIMEEKVSLNTVAPTILDLLQIDKPDHMRGHSLLTSSAS